MTVRRGGGTRELRASRFGMAGLAAGFLLLPGCTEQQPHTISGNFNTMNAQGWSGNQFAVNRILMSEELDSNRDRRIDFWRYYDRGRLVAEERDLRGDGRIHYVSLWEPDTRQLLSAGRDSSGQGVFDLQIERQPGNHDNNLSRWLISEDRNRDGFVDLTLLVEGPPTLIQDTVGDVAVAPSVWEAIPSARWIELRRDDAYTGTLGPGVRFQGGVAVAREAALANGERRWERLPAGADPYTYISPAAAAPADTGAGGRTGSPTISTLPEDAGLYLPPDGDDGLYLPPDGGAIDPLSAPVDYGQGSGGGGLYGAHLAPGPGTEVSSAAAERAVRRRFPNGIPDGESTAGAVPKNMRVRLPGQ